jgi:serine/threonine transporter
MKTLKAVAARYNATSLILRIVIGLVVGAVLALAAGWKSSAACSWVP